MKSKNNKNISQVKTVTETKPEKCGWPNANAHTNALYAYASISNLEQLAICNNLILIYSVNKRFPHGLLLDAGHIKAIDIIPNWSKHASQGNKTDIRTIKMPPPKAFRVGKQIQIAHETTHATDVSEIPYSYLLLESGCAAKFHTFDGSTWKWFSSTYDTKQ